METKTEIRKRKFKSKGSFSKIMHQDTHEYLFSFIFRSYEFEGATTSNDSTRQMYRKRIVANDPSRLPRSFCNLQDLHRVTRLAFPSLQTAIRRGF